MYHHQGHSFVNGVCERCGKNKADFVESLHPYEDYTDETYTIHKDGAKRIAVVFSENTETEYNYDYISIYDKDNNMVGQYSGTELSGKKTGYSSPPSEKEKVLVSSPSAISQKNLVE